MAAYIRRKNGVSAGARGSLRNMLARSLGSRSFAGFWQHWNPAFGYALGRFVYQPLRQLFSRASALMLTFLACGAIHDLVTMAVRRSFALLFTPWFLFLGVGMLAGEATGMNTAHLNWIARALVNVSYLAVTLALALWVKDLAGM